MEMCEQDRDIARGFEYRLFSLIHGSPQQAITLNLEGNLELECDIIRKLKSFPISWIETERGKLISPKKNAYFDFTQRNRGKKILSLDAKFIKFTLELDPNEINILSRRYPILGNNDLCGKTIILYYANLEKKLLEKVDPLYNSISQNRFTKAYFMNSEKSKEFRT